jgi:hypothetical protein
VAHGLIKDADLRDLGLGEANLVEAPRLLDHPHWDRPEIHDIYRSWRRITDSYGTDRIFVAETWVNEPDRLASHVRPDELHTAFNFDFLSSSWHLDQRVFAPLKGCVDLGGTREFNRFATNPARFCSSTTASNSLGSMSSAVKCRGTATREWVTGRSASRPRRRVYGWSSSTSASGRSRSNTM